MKALLARTFDKMGGQAIPFKSWVYSLNPLPLQVGTTITTAAIEHGAPLLHDERRFPVKLIRTNDYPHERDNISLVQTDLSVKITLTKK